VGDGLASQLGDDARVEVVGRTRDHLDLFDLVDGLRPDAVVISIRSSTSRSMPTIGVARQLRQAFGQLGIVIISGNDEACVLEAIGDGSSRVAYLLDERLVDLSSLVSALRAVCAGRSVLDPAIVDSLVNHYQRRLATDLSRREPEVLEQMARGLSNRAIASVLNISVKAIEKDITAIFRKLELSDRTLVDRRVTASLAFLRTLANPFGPRAEVGASPPRQTHVVVSREQQR
jgi:DNA-binding NarL/FixJ family response regulator